MLKRIIAAAVLSIAAPASAGTVLWQNVEAGMTPEQLHTLYPPGPGVKYHASWMMIHDVQVAGCKGWAVVSYKGGRVSRVDLGGSGCEGPLLGDLIGKYGPPLSDDVNHKDPKKLLSDTDHEAVWRNAGRIIRYKGTTNGISGSWQLRYSPINDSGI